MYYSYFTRNGIEYASAASSVREGGRVTKGEQVYLGRVVDKERHIFRSRERGLFAYDIDKGEFLDPPRGYDEAPTRRKNARRKPKVLTVSFGDAWLLDRFLRDSGLMECVEACCSISGPAPEIDTVCALLEYYVLCSLSNCHAEDWWRLTYARMMYPKARMSSQRAGEALADLGTEEAKRAFFAKYLQLTERTDDGILIDSTGVPNVAKLPTTAISNHNGVAGEECRLIYVARQRTGLPLFFRLVAGNVVDVSTVSRTVRKLRKLGADTKFAILDAGYYSHASADALMEAGVSFLMRMDSGSEACKDAVAEHLPTLESRENAVIYNGRLVYVKRVPCKIGKRGDRPAYLYLCMDETMRGVQNRDAIARAAELGKSAAELHDELADKGVFVLVSTRKIAVEKLLPLYYTRDRVEKVFEIAKQGAKLLPVNVETEATLRGHLLLSFVATVALKMMSDRLAQSKTSLTTESMLAILHEHHATVYDDEAITQEPVRKMREAYDAFGLKCPESIKRTDVA